MIFNDLQLFTIQNSKFAMNKTKGVDFRSRNKHGNLITIRNKRIKERYWELIGAGKNRIQALEKMKWEFYLEERTLQDIVYSKKKMLANPISNTQMLIF